MSDRVGSLSGTGGHILLGSGQLTVGDNNASTTFGGDITGTNSGFLSKAGTGTLTLTGTSTYSGPTFVDGGTLEINGSQPNSTVEVFGGTLRGTGTIGTLIAFTGTVAPGRGAGTGRLTVNGNVVLSEFSTFRVRLNGTTPGTQFDQLRVSGPEPRAVTLSNCRLDATIGFNAVAGTRFSIIDNTTDGDAPTDTFEGMAQGQLVTIPGALGAPDQAFRTDYTGGNFNDVDLIRNTPPMVEYIFLDPEEIAAGEYTAVVGQLTDPDPEDYLGLYISWGDGSDDEVEYPGLEPFAYYHQYESPGEYDVFAYWFDPSGEGNFRVLPLTVLPAGAPGGAGGRPATSDPSARGVDDPSSLLRGSAGGVAPVSPVQQTSHVTDGAFGGEAGASMAWLDIPRRLPAETAPLAGGIRISPDSGTAPHGGADRRSRRRPAPAAGAVPDGLSGPQSTAACAVAAYSPEGALLDELAMRLQG
jgi:autotransporter-associated beta strand protein